MDKSPLLMVIFLFFGCQIPDMYKFFWTSLLHQHLQRSIQRVSAKVAATVVAQGPIQCNPWRSAFHRIFLSFKPSPNGWGSQGWLSSYFFWRFSGFNYSWLVFWPSLHHFLQRLVAPAAPPAPAAVEAHDGRPLPGGCGAPVFVKDPFWLHRNHLPHGNSLLLSAAWENQLSSPRLNQLWSTYIYI